MGQHTTNQADGVHLWMQVPEQTPKVVKDSITSYAGYFADSLNSGLTNKAFRFELKEIILPDEDAKSESLQTVYPSMLNPKGSHRYSPYRRKIVGSIFAYFICLINTKNNASNICRFHWPDLPIIFCHRCISTQWPTF